MKIFQALPSETRIQIPELTKDRGFYMAEIAEELDSSINNISQHIKILKKVGLIKI